MMTKDQFDEIGTLREWGMNWKQIHDYNTFGYKDELGLGTSWSRLLRIGKFTEDYAENEKALEHIREQKALEAQTMNNDSLLYGIDQSIRSCVLGAWA